MRGAVFLATLVGAVALSAIPDMAQVAPLRVEDVVAMHSFSEGTPVTLSPDDKRLAYTVKDNRRTGVIPFEQFHLSGVPFNALGADIFVVQITTGDVTNLTGGSGNNWAPAWSPDGRDLAFLSDRDGSGQAKLWVWETATGNLRKVSDISVRTLQLQWLPDSSAVLIGVVAENLTAVGFATGITGLTLNGNESAR